MKRLKDLQRLQRILSIKIDTLDAATDVPDVDVYAVGMYYKDTVLPAMDALRETADTLETIVAKEYWPFPTYTDLLYLV